MKSNFFWLTTEGTNETCGFMDAVVQGTVLDVKILINVVALLVVLVTMMTGAVIGVLW